MCVWGGLCVNASSLAHTCRWISEDNFQVCVFSWNPQGFRAWTQTVSWHSKYLYWLSHLTSPMLIFLTLLPSPTPPNGSISLVTHWFFLCPNDFTRGGLWSRRGQTEQNRPTLGFVIFRSKLLRVQGLDSEDGVLLPGIFDVMAVRLLQLTLSG